MKLHTEHKGSRPYRFRQDFFMFPYLAYVKFWPKGDNLDKLGRGLLGDATYKISKLSPLWFQRRRFLKFSS